MSYLGFQAIRNLAMSVEIFSQWPRGSCAGLDLNRLQQHAHTVAAAAGALTAKTPLADEAMLAGLLHDIGYWILAQECPDDLSNAVELAVSTDIALHAAETRIIGASHAEIGAYLLGIWGLPYSVVEPWRITINPRASNTRASMSWRPSSSAIPSRKRTARRHSEPEFRLIRRLTKATSSPSKRRSIGPRPRDGSPRSATHRRLQHEPAGSPPGTMRGR